MKKCNSVSCYKSHSPIEIGGGVVFGGNCHSPICNDADVYVNLDTSKTGMSFPWESPIHINFEIPNFGVPLNSKAFVKLISFLKEQLEEGKKIHVGCIGGHGRTGMVLAALACVVESKKDAIQYIRSVYCSKAVETKSQVIFLVSNFLMDSAPVVKVSHPSKLHLYEGSSKSFHGFVSTEDVDEYLDRKFRKYP